MAPLKLQDLKQADLKEVDWQRQVLDAARLFGWRVAHFRPALTKHGWRTPVAADGEGFPDLLLVKHCVLAVELKSQKGRLRPAQKLWLEAFDKAGVKTYVWRPDDVDEMLAVLSNSPSGRPS